MELTPSDRVRLLRKLETWVGPFDCVPLSEISKRWFADRKIEYSGTQLRDMISIVRAVASGSSKYECVLASGGYSVRTKRSGTDEAGNIHRTSNSRSPK